MCNVTPSMPEVFRHSILLTNRKTVQPTSEVSTTSEVSKNFGCLNIRQAKVMEINPDQPAALVKNIRSFCKLRILCLIGEWCLKPKLPICHCPSAALLPPPDSEDVRAGEFFAPGFRVFRFCQCCTCAEKWFCHGRTACQHNEW